MFDLGDLATLIRLVEIDLYHLKLDTDSEDDETRDNAGELIIQVDNLAGKLKIEYEAQWTDENGFPRYVEYLEIIKRHPPFNEKV
ncbi:MAG: hypothetical protein OEZ39_19825 [Gammaproteobacteria bacterium]|nr:hypothetical protein [Gammaproteobacteria bacterium]MDH5654117.1 hypothetical protein [Gammaproteobacteria bacterium]